MKSKSPLISVVMLNYNGLEYLKRTIPPILKLDYPNFEFIIVDNGSTDGSIEFIKKFKKIKLIENGENLGYSKGKNIGVKNAKGEYVLLLDNDILIYNKKILNDLLKFYITKKEIAFTYVPCKDLQEKDITYYGIYYSLYGTNMHLGNIKFSKLRNLKENPVIGSPEGNNMFFKRKIWIKLGGFDESQIFNLDDMDIGPRAWIFGFKNYLYTQTFFIHLGINKTDSAEAYANRFRLLYSGHSRSMFKNYKLTNLILRFPILCIFQTLKAIRYSFKKKSLKVFLAFLSSIKLFLNNLPDTLSLRNDIQSKRKVQEDIFLKIKTPKLD